MKLSQSRNSIDAICYFNSAPLTVVDHSKYLGVILQSDLNWKKHVEQKVSKASSMLALIQRNLKISSIKIKELAYKALVRPQLEYASSYSMVSLAAGFDYNDQEGPATCC